MNKKKILSLIMAGAMTMSLLSGLATTTSYVKADDGELTDGLVARWSFDDDYEESVNGLTTSLGAKNLNYIEGVHGKAAVFNGKDNYLIVDADPVLNLGNSSEENNDNFSLSAWINLYDASYTTKYLLDKGNYSQWDKDDNYFWTNPYRVGFDICAPFVELSNGYEDFNVEPAIVWEGDSRTTGKYVEGQEWFLLTVTYDGDRVKVYRDNELLMQSNYTDGIAFNNEELYIGVDCKLSSFFKGAVDDLRLYSKTLSYDDVDALYNSGLEANVELVEPTKKLVAYYPFDDNLKDESAFGNDAEKVAIGGTTKYIVGKNGKAITMSKGNYINIKASDQLNFEREFTVSFWIKLNEKKDDVTCPILYRQNPSNSDDNDNEWTYRCYISSWGNMENTEIDLTSTVYNPDSWTPEYALGVRTSTDYETKKIKGSDWIHYTATYKDGQLKTYFNGILQMKSEEADLIDIYNASGDLLIGYDGETFIDGALDEFKMYNSCLSATDVEKEYKRVDSISISKDTAGKLATLGKGKSVTINEILLKDIDSGDSHQVKLSNKNFTFSTSNKNVFTVTGEGKITGVKAGSAKLTITYGAHTVTYTVKVK